MTIRPGFAYDEAIGESAIGEQGVSDPGNRRRRLVLVFAASLLVRALLAIPVVLNDTPPRFDEQSYFRRAAAFMDVLGDAVRFRTPRPDAWDTFYEAGARPPFQSVVLALGMLIPGRSVAAARFTMVLLSALTTVLILLVTERLAGPKAGLAASVLFLAYPSFLAFSHYLWAETTFIFLLLLSVHLALLVMDSGEPGRRARLSILLGVVLGCLAMTRSAALGALVLLPVWILAASKGKRARLAGPALVLVLAFITLLPWEYALYRMEHQLVPLANNSEVLYLAHNPWQENAEDGFDDGVRGRMELAIKEYMEDRAVSRRAAAKALALREIKSHFGAFLAQCGREALYLWTFDFFPLRQVVNVAYPPMPALFVFPLVLVLAASAILLYLLALKGLMVRTERLRGKVMILALIAAGAAPYVLSFGSSRYNLPQIALLFPIAGFGLAHLRERTKAFVPLSLLAAAGCLVLFVRSYPEYINLRLRPSSAYAEALGPMDEALGARSLYADSFILSDPGPAGIAGVTLEIANEDGSEYSFDRERPRKRIYVAPSRKRRWFPFIVYGLDVRGPLKLRVGLGEGGGDVDLTPVDRAFWDRSRDIGLGGLRLRWKGGR